MRGKRLYRDEKDKEMVELTFESDESNSVVPYRKKRRTFLESFETLTLSMAENSSGDDGSSCATGGSINPSDDDAESLDGEGDVLLSDQEKAHRAIMYQLVTGKTTQPLKNDVVHDRLEQLIRISRLKAAQDDFNLQVKRSEIDLMELDGHHSVKRSNSLPQEFSKIGDRPMESVDVEIPFVFESL